MFMKFIVLALISMSLINHPGPGTSFRTAVHIPAVTKMDQPYGSDAAQKMDVYLPEGRSAASTPVLVLIHGGGWNSGDKRDFISYIDSFRTRMPHYAVFNLNYRLFNGEHIFPTQEEDVRSALSYITSHAGELRHQQ
jgi:acetyl esterase/lipase